MGVFDRAGLRLSYEFVEGRSDLVPRIFVNGSGAAASDVVPLLALFAGSASIAVLDHRGMGRSDTPSVPPTMADFAADVRALIDHLEWSEVDLIGISFGGMVAQELVCQDARNVRRLVLACTSAGGAGGSSYPLHDLIDITDEERRRRLPSLQDTRFTDEWLRTHDGVAERLVTNAQPPPTSAGYRLQMEARRHHDVWDRLASVDRPTLVASGRFDGIAPPENGARIAERLPDAVHRVYEGGHLFFLQDRRFFVDLEEFLDPSDVVQETR